jgi:uncharacterized protein (DUF58 family)
VSPSRSGKPVASPRALFLLSLALVPSLFALARPGLVVPVLLADLFLGVLCFLDFALAPRADELGVERRVPSVLSSGVPVPVELLFTSKAHRPLRGVWQDTPPVALRADEGTRRGRFALSSTRRQQTAIYRLSPETRGDFRFGDVSVRLLGPWGLCFRQVQVPLPFEVKVYPDLRALSRDALLTAGAENDVSRVRTLKGSEGREFESLRDYRSGDDFRAIDWKATARRAKPVVRVHQPEQNQPVLLLLDCGRHMAGRVHGRRKLDHAVDACLRLARVCLEAGDHVGVVAFARSVHSLLMPRKGVAQLRALAHALYRVDARLEESDYVLAIDTAFQRQHKRTLAVLFTDLMDPQTSAALIRPTLRLRPRHVPFVVSLHDEALSRAATASPEGVHDAYARQVASGLEEEYRRTTIELRHAGAQVVRAPARTLSASAINQYLELKRRGVV